MSSSHSFVFTITACVLGLLCASAAAQEHGSRFELRVEDFPMSRLGGMAVRTAAGSQVGEVKDVVFDGKTGRVEYLALAEGGFLGLAETLRAFPIARFQPSADRGELLIDVTEAEMAASEAFSTRDWPNLRADGAFWAKLDRSFGDTPSTAGGTAKAAAGEPRRLRAAELLGEKVEDHQGEPIATLHDLVVNLREARVRLAILDTLTEERVVPVPVDALAFFIDGSEVAMRYERGSLDINRALSKDRWLEQLRGNGEKTPPPFQHR